MYFNRHENFKNKNIYGGTSRRSLCKAPPGELGLDSRVRLRARIGFGFGLDVESGTRLGLRFGLVFGLGLGLGIGQGLGLGLLTQLY